jgi:ACS family tartrate transporter-like MFS transporter
VALPALFAAAAFLAMSFAQSDLLSLVAMGFAVVGLIALQPPFFSLLSIFLSGPAAASGIALVISLSNVGSFLGPSLVGVLRQQTGGYGAAMAGFALVLVMAAGIVLATGRAMAPRAVVQVRPPTPSARASDSSAVADRPSTPRWGRGN